MKRNKINGNQITNNPIIQHIEKTTTGHRTKAEKAEKQSRLQLIEKLYKQELNNKPGITTEYNPEYAKQAYMLALLGATMQMIAIYFDTDVQIIDRWGRENLAFYEALKRGRIEFDMQVAEKLGMRAMGYDYVEKEEWEVYDKKTGEVHTLHKIYHKHMPPDVTAQQFWLQNRQRGLWTNTSKIEMHNAIDINVRKQIDLSILSNVEAESVKQIAIAMLSKDKGSMEVDKK